jgi:hypothetical protein
VEAGVEATAVQVLGRETYLNVSQVLYVSEPGGVKLVKTGRLEKCVFEA